MSGHDAQRGAAIDCDGSNFVLAFEATTNGVESLAVAEFGYVTFSGGTTFRCVEAQINAVTSTYVLGRSTICAEASGGGTRGNMLLDGTRWNATGSTSGDPFIALYAR